MMMSQVARALGATLHGKDVLMTGVSKDTRDINEGDLYMRSKESALTATSLLLKRMHPAQLAHW